jgi:hypothetical protein
MTIWVGGTGETDGWLLQDVTVVDIRMGRAFFFPCGEGTKPKSRVLNHKPQNQKHEMWLGG